MSEPTAPQDHPDQAGDTGLLVERRAWVRHACHLEVPCQPVSDRTTEVIWQAVLRDISPGGAGLVLGREFRPGSVLRLDLPGARGRPVGMLAVVRYCHRQDDGRWRVGCEFARKLKPRELRRLL